MQPCGLGGGGSAGGALSLLTGGHSDPEGCCAAAISTGSPGEAGTAVPGLAVGPCCVARCVGTAFNTPYLVNLSSYHQGAGPQAPLLS